MLHTRMQQNPQPNGLWTRLKALFESRPLTRYVAAAGLVGATVLVRFALDPLLGEVAMYHLYYPAVILAAYLLGARPALFATLLSAFVAYWFFSAPILQVKPDLQAHLPLVTFLVSSSVAIFVLSHVRSRLTFLTAEYRRIDALTISQAELFREHAEQVSNHLQLISALLQAESRQSEDENVSGALRMASQRSMMISRMHRSFAGRDIELIDFKLFAERLAAASTAAQGKTDLRLRIEGERLMLTLEQATAAGLVLLECLEARGANGGELRVRLRETSKLAELRIAEEGAAAGRAQLRNALILNAIADQMGGSLSMTADRGEPALVFTFPHIPSPAAAAPTR